MALLISFRCVNCWGCVAECPEKAIKPTEPVFHIDQQACNECSDSIKLPRCVSVCPVEDAITDRFGQSLLSAGARGNTDTDKLAEALDIEKLRLYEEWMY